MTNDWGGFGTWQLPRLNGVPDSVLRQTTQARVPSLGLSFDGVPGAPEIVRDDPNRVPLPNLGEDAETFGTVDRGDALRDAMVWTSKKRIAQLNYASKTTRELQRLRATSQALSALSQMPGPFDLFALAVPATATGYAADVIQRFQNEPKAVLPYVTMAVNPSTIGFTQPKKIVPKDTMSRKKFLHFTDRRGSNRDVLTLSFAGNSGDIDLRGLEEGDLSTALDNLRKLISWLNLYGLTCENPYHPMVGKNEMILTYKSNALPHAFTGVPIEMHGHFPAVMQWDQTGDKMFSITYKFEFVVHYTVPDIPDAIEALIARLQKTRLATQQALNSPLLLGTRG